MNEITIKEIFKGLNDHKVPFIVVGGLAVIEELKIAKNSKNHTNDSKRASNNSK